MKVNNKKGSNTRKIIPAVGMLSVSAIMLASSTYAWFTMSREVEVTGINMVATVPEDLQISLGKLKVAGTGGTAELVSNTGILDVAADGTAVDPVVANDWSNAAVISSYYEMGKLIPASSTTGQNIYFTPDANGVGKTVAGEANYYQAAAGLTAYKANAAGTAFGTGNDYAADSAMATLHAATASNKTAAATAITTSWKENGYTPSDTWTDTNDDGYYVDIPVWIRSSSDEAVSLKVSGYVTPIIPGESGSYNKPVSEADLELYQAARVAILHGASLTAPTTNPTGIVTCTGGNAVQSNNIIPLNNPVTAVTKNETTGAVTAVTYADNKFGTTSILDSVNYVTRASKTANTLWGVSGLETADDKADGTGTFVGGTYTQYQAYDATATGNANVVATIEGSGDNVYGTAKKLVLRIWLDGEDEQCWNQNAGQDFAITLKFEKI